MRIVRLLVIRLVGGFCTRYSGLVCSLFSGSVGILCGRIIPGFSRCFRIGEQGNMISAALLFTVRDLSRFRRTVRIVPQDKFRRVQNHFAGIVRPVVRVLSFLIGIDGFGCAADNAAHHVNHQRQQQKGGREPPAMIKLLHVRFPPLWVSFPFSFRIFYGTSRKSPAM